MSKKKPEPNYPSDHDFWVKDKVKTLKSRIMSRAEKTWRKKYVELLVEVANKEAQEVQTAQKVVEAKTRGCVLAQLDRSLVKRQNVCTHRKGGVISNIKDPAAINHALSHGTAMSYAVIKHQMINRDIWVRCLRCGKWWKPPCRSEYNLDRDYWKAMFEYETALEFPTNNTMSGSVLCNFYQTLKDGTQVDASEVLRQRMANFR
jgi:hypothetical protein